MILLMIYELGLDRKASAVGEGIGLAGGEEWGEECGEVWVGYLVGVSEL